MANKDDKQDAGTTARANVEATGAAPNKPRTTAGSGPAGGGTAPAAAGRGGGAGAGPAATSAAGAGTARRHDSAVEAFDVVMLDVGSKEYGDCILCKVGRDTILVDGSHPGDDRISFSIPDQLRALLGQPDGPLRVSLLVITHVHSDHYGCLPEMIRDGTLKADFALLADPQLGWGEIPGEGGENLLDALAAAHPTARRLALALREELPSDDDDNTIRALLDAAESARDRYQAMIRTLEQGRTTVVRYGVDDHAALLGNFAHLNLQVLGPSRTQLEVCARVIAEALRGALDRVTAAGTLDTEGVTDEIELFRQLAAGDERADARSLKGAALNNQSIVLQFDVAGKKVLLTGDMQLVKPEIQEVDDERRELRKTIRDGRPYAFFKIPHHASNDSFDKYVLGDVIAEDGTAPLLGISTGTKGSAHPSGEALGVLRASSGRVTWARTDRNGQVTFRFGPDGDRAMPRRGALNDATPKPERRPRPRRPRPQDAAAALSVGDAAGLSGDAPAVSGERIDIVTPGGIRVTIVAGATGGSGNATHGGGGGPG
jgi:beta-lactamase superfamily II metal-dependent hydrolase